MTPKIKYDSEVNVLTIRLNNNKSTDSKIHKNCVIDYDKNGQITNIEVMDLNLEKILSKK